MDPERDQGESPRQKGANGSCAQVSQASGTRNQQERESFLQNMSETLGELQKRSQGRGVLRYAPTSDDSGKDSSADQSSPSETFSPRCSDSGVLSRNDSSESDNRTSDVQDVALSSDTNAREADGETSIPRSNPLVVQYVSSPAAGTSNLDRPESSGEKSLQSAKHSNANVTVTNPAAAKSDTDPTENSLKRSVTVRVSGVGVSGLDSSDCFGETPKPIAEEVVETGTRNSLEVDETAELNTVGCVPSRNVPQTAADKHRSHADLPETAFKGFQNKSIQDRKNFSEASNPDCPQLRLDGETMSKGARSEPGVGEGSGIPGRPRSEPYVREEQGSSRSPPGGTVRKLAIPVGDATVGKIHHSASKRTGSPDLFEGEVKVESIVGSNAGPSLLEVKPQQPDLTSNIRPSVIERPSPVVVVIGESSSASTSKQTSGDHPSGRDDSNQRPSQPPGSVTIPFNIFHPLTASPLEEVPERGSIFNSRPMLYIYMVVFFLYLWGSSVRLNEGWFTYVGVIGMAVSLLLFIRLFFRVYVWDNRFYLFSIERLYLQH